MRRHLILSAIWAVAVAIFALLMSLTPIAERLENQYALGLLYGLRPQVERAPGAAVVAIDRKTLEWLRDDSDTEGKGPLLSCLPPGVKEKLAEVRGPGSIPRSVHGCALAELKRLGFKAAIFDILFMVPGAKDDDEEFARALKSNLATGILVGFERSMVRDGVSEVLVERELEPIDLFRTSAATTGAFLLPRPGGPVYGYWPRVAGFPETKSLPEEALFLIGSPLYAALSTSIASPALRYFWLYGPPGTIETISLRDLLRRDVDPSIPALAPSSIAFIGASDPSSTNYPDSFPTFIRGGSDADLSGVELAATAFLNLLHGDTVRRLPLLETTLLILAFAAAVGFLARFNPTYAILSAIPIGLLYVAFAAWLFARAHLFMPVATPVFILLPAAFVAAIFMRYRLARSLIMRLAPAPVARRRLGLMTEERSKAVSDEATVIFFDLIGSTKIAEKLAPLDFSVLLNSYHDTITKVVEAHGGFINAYSGDGVMAAFTRIDAGADHALRACRSSIRVVREMRRFNAANAGKSIPPLHLRVGINSGTVAEGEIGAANRFNFSVVGDVVNLASRLEQLGKVLFAGENDIILLGHRTRQLAGDNGLKFADCGLQEIRGRDKAEQVHRLLVADA
ncbi:adenylate/guanylate cyclase domain-containing protein [Taklimakanibacter deserti]|uniref:adenylate/guanylate cyclase domain-containing protein n=1 Tax=Taklimakanibacter deserti TaxID=2267839 RepID=UPI0013C45123